MTEWDRYAAHGALNYQWLWPLINRRHTAPHLHSRYAHLRQWHSRHPRAAWNDGMVHYWMWRNLVSCRAVRPSHSLSCHTSKPIGV